MEKPRHISSEEARRWNEDVERRRLAHHERRCAEDAMYRRAYEYQQAEEQRMWSQMHKPFADMMAAAAEIRAQLTETKDGSHVFMPAECVAQQIEPNVDTQQVHDIKEEPRQVKSREEVMRDQAAMEAYQRMTDAEKAAAGGNALAMGLIGMMFLCPDALQRRMKELEELKPYLDEIRETDKRYRSEEIKLSGFEW